MNHRRRDGGKNESKKSGINRAKFEQNSGIIRENIRATYFLLLLLLACQNMLSEILGACMYPFADTGIEDRIFLAREKSVLNMLSEP